MAARKPTPKAAAEKAAATPPPAAVVVDKDATDADVNAAQEQAEADAKAAEELAAKEKALADAKAAEELAAKKKAEDEREYLVSEPLLHNGDSYKPGDYIYLTRGFAESLKAKGIITNAGE